MKFPLGKSTFLAIPISILTLACSGDSKDPAPTPQPEVPSAYFVSQTELYSCQLSSSGKDTLIGTIRQTDGGNVSLTDLAVASDGSIFGNSFTQLFSIDPKTAIATKIGDNTLEKINALASNQKGELYGASLNNGEFYTVNTLTGETKKLGSYGSNFVSSGDIAFDLNGILYGTARKSDGEFDTLSTIDLVTGTATPKFTNLPKETWGLSFVNNILYGATTKDNEIFTIDLSTGKTTKIRELSFKPYGGRSYSGSTSNH